MKRQRGLFRGNCLAAKGRLSGGIIERQYNYSEGDELLYRRVSAVLNTAPNSNPLANILDRPYMMTLQGAERERYVFMLSEQVQRCVQRYEQEKEFERTRMAR